MRSLEMSSILVIEDDSNKLTQLCNFLKENMRTVDVRTARSLQGGIKQVRASVPSLVLLDMTLPNFDATPDDPGGKTHNFGGREFLVFQLRVIDFTQSRTDRAHVDPDSGRQAFPSLLAPFADLLAGEIDVHVVLEN